jgi:hypothetical protein
VATRVVVTDLPPELVGPLRRAGWLPVSATSWVGQNDKVRHSSTVLEHPDDVETPEDLRDLVAS